MKYFKSIFLMIVFFMSGLLYAQQAIITDSTGIVIGYVDADSLVHDINSSIVGDLNIAPSDSSSSTNITSPTWMAVSTQLNNLNEQPEFDKHVIL
ncbi:MAG: hypothetical protein ACHQF2_05205, partial [Flavobacteriales bacterium]